MKNHKLTFLPALLLCVFTGVSVAQPPTTAKTFRMYNDATHTLSITLDPAAAAGTGTFTFPQPSLGIFHSTAGGAVTLGAVALNTADVSGTLNVSNGGTGNTIVGAANSVAFSDGTKIVYTAAPTAAVNSILVSIGGAAPTYSTTLPSSISVPFTNITSGTNTTAAMLVGAGASLAPTGAGTITGNQFVGTGSTTNAVDLATGEVAGTLPVANGGTGVTTVAAGSILLGNGTSPMTALAPGTNGQELVIVGGVPTWTTLPAGIVAKGRVAGDGVNFSYTITPSSPIPVGSTINVSLESTTNAAITVTGRTGTTSFTVQAPIILSATDFINYLIF